MFILPSLRCISYYLMILVGLNFPLNRIHPAPRPLDQQTQQPHSSSSSDSLNSLISLIKRVEEDDLSGFGQIENKQLDAVRTARSLSPGRWQSLALNAQGQSPQNAQADAGEQQLTLNVSIALGNGPARQERALELAVQRVEIHSRLHRGNRISEALSGLSEVWLERIRLSRLKYLVQTLQTLSQPLIDGAGLSTLDQLDLSLAIEDAQLRAKTAEGQLEAQFEKLRGLLSNTLIDDLKTSRLNLDLFASPPPFEPPWIELLNSFSQLPQLQIQQKKAEHLEARADASDASYPWSLSLGGGMTMVGDGRWAMGTFSLSAPLSTPARAEEARLRLEASASRAEYIWLSQRLKARFEAKIQRWQSERARLELLNAHRQQLFTRENLTQRAARAHHIPLTRTLSALEASTAGTLEWAQLNAMLWAEVAHANITLRTTQSNFIQP